MWWRSLAAGLYLLAAARYYQRFRAQPGAVLLAVVTAFVLLAEALLAAALARNWQLSWWEWHVLLITGYAFVAYTSTTSTAARATRAGCLRRSR